MIPEKNSWGKITIQSIIMNLSTCKPFFNEVHNLVNTEDNYLTAQINFACTVYQFKYKVFIDRNIIYSKKKKKYKLLFDVWSHLLQGSISYL